MVTLKFLYIEALNGGGTGPTIQMVMSSYYHAFKDSGYKVDLIKINNINDLINFDIDDDIHYVLNITYAGKRGIVGVNIKKVLNKHKLIIVNTELVTSKMYQWFRDQDILNNSNLIAILDYIHLNIRYFKNELNFDRVYYTPPGYSTIFHDYFKLNNYNGEKDIDVLMYGSRNYRRRNIVAMLHKLGLKVVFTGFNNLTTQIEHIKRSKMILNVYYYGTQIFDYYRDSFLYSNNVLVINEDIDGEDEETQKLKNNLIFVQYDKLPMCCLEYVNMSNEERTNIALKHSEFYKNNFLTQSFIQNLEI